MITVKRLIEELSKLPEDALAYAYEGEIDGVVIRRNGKELGWIPASEYDEVEDNAFVPRKENV
jgi:hypothetical protein